MNPFFAGAFEAFRRRLERHQDRPPRSSEPLWRLLAEEVRLALGWLARRKTVRAWLPALLVGLAVGVGFSDALPGPVLQGPWRLTASAGVVAVVGVWLHVRVDGQAQR